MLRLGRKVEDGHELDEKCKPYIDKILTAYGMSTLRHLKDIIKRADTETVKVDLDDLFKMNRVSAEEISRNTQIEECPSLRELIRYTAYTFNQKALIAMTKEKHNLTLQNLIKAIGVQSQLVQGPGSVLILFILYVNTAFTLYKLDKISDSILFCNKALLLGEESLQNAIVDQFASEETYSITRTFSFSLLFTRGGEMPELRGEYEYEKVARWVTYRPREYCGRCSRILTSSLLRYSGLSRSNKESNVGTKRLTMRLVWERSSRRRLLGLEERTLKRQLKNKWV